MWIHCPKKLTKMKMGRMQMETTLKRRSRKSRLWSVTLTHVHDRSSASDRSFGCHFQAAIMQNLQRKGKKKKKAKDSDADSQIADTTAASVGRGAKLTESKGKPATSPADSTVPSEDDDSLYFITNDREMGSKLISLGHELLEGRFLRCLPKLLSHMDLHCIPM